MRSARSCFFRFHCLKPPFSQMVDCRAHHRGQTIGARLQFRGSGLQIGILHVLPQRIDQVIRGEILLLNIDHPENEHANDRGGHCPQHNHHGSSSHNHVPEAGFPLGGRSRNFGRCRSGCGLFFQARNVQILGLGGREKE